MKKTIYSFKKIAVAFSLLALAFTACKKAEVTPDSSTVLFKNASPDMATVDVSVDGKKINTAALAYNSNTGYLSVNAGARAIKITNSATGAVLVNSNVTLIKDRNYSMFVANRTATPEGILLEDFQSATVAGKAHVRIMNLSPDAPAYLVGITGATTNTFSGAAFKTATTFALLDAVAAGTAVAFQVKHPTTNAVVATVNTTLMPGKVYTIVIRGFVTPPTGNTNALGTTVITNR